MQGVIPQGDKVGFSERYGYKPIKEIIQIESMDEPQIKSLTSKLLMYFFGL